MSALQIVLSISDILFAIAIIVLFLVQEGNDQGLGAVTGATTDSYTVKAKGRTLEEQLKRWTNHMLCCFRGSFHCSLFGSCKILVRRK